MDNWQDEFFREVTLRVCGSLDIKKAIRQCLDYLNKSMPVDEIAVDLLDPDLVAIRRIAHVSAAGATASPEIIPLPPDKYRTMLKHLDGDVYCIGHTGQDPYTKQFTPYVKNHGFSEILLPLKIEDRSLGLLILRAQGYNRYTAEHSHLISSVREPMTIAVANALSHQKLHEDNQFLRQELQSRTGTEIIGENGGLRQVMNMVRQVSPLNTTALLMGETGVGKEVIANAIHHLSPRKDGPFIKVNCGAIPENLIDSELFGHEKGAFSGAHTRKLGRFERANKGTLFLDEIGELPPQAQVRLLRVLQFREVERVGGSCPIPVDIRIIAATHRKLDDMVAEGRFREDLWFRLNAYPIQIPPLRRRPEDLHDLIQHLLAVKSKELGFRNPPPVAEGAMRQLTSHHWPGNVRELENVVERALIQARGRHQTMVRFALPDNAVGEDPLKSNLCNCVFPCLAQKNTGKENNVQPENSHATLDQVIKHHIEKALSQAGGKIHGPKGAAQRLGMNPSTLRNKMNKLGIIYGRNARRKDNEGI